MKANLAAYLDSDAALARCLKALALMEEDQAWRFIPFIKRVAVEKHFVINGGGRGGHV